MIAVFMMSVPQHATYMTPSDWSCFDMDRNYIDHNQVMMPGQGYQLPPLQSSVTCSPNVDDGLTSLSWLQNLNMCMTRLGAPTPPTPPASPSNPLMTGTGTNSSLHPSHSYPITFGNNQNQNPMDTSSNQSNATSSQSACRQASSYMADASSNHSASQPDSHTNQHLRQHQLHHAPSSRSKKLLANAAAAQVQEEAIDYKVNGSAKPPFSYATLICMAMKANKNKMTLNSIYKWIRENFLYYQKADPSWQVTIIFLILSLPLISFSYTTLQLITV